VEPKDNFKSQLYFQREEKMIQAFVFIEAEPSRVQDLVEELAGMELDSSVIKQVYAVTGRYDLIALIESPDIASLGD
jgi:DNA-binding Lrp family transcriptional regulator